MTYHIKPSEFEVILLAAGCSRRLSHLTQTQPKSFLSVGGQRIIERNLTILDSLGFENVTVVVGYQKEVFYEKIGKQWGKLNLCYVESLDFDTTGHGWSLYMARDIWMNEQRPVLLVHADVLYDKRILELLLSSPDENVIVTDNCFESKTGDEILVYGETQHITEIRKIGESDNTVLGEIVGLNRWSAQYMTELFDFMDNYFIKNGRHYNWEPVVNAFLPTASLPLSALLTEGLLWMNINYEDDLHIAQQYAELFDSETNVLS